MRIVLGSGGFATEHHMRVLARHVRALFGDVQRVLFIPYALRDHDEYLRKVVERGYSAGYTLDGIHQEADPGRAIRQAEAIFVGGGNTFRLLGDLYRHGLVDLIRQRVRAGIPYLGISAGTNVACPTIKTTNDMPITLPPRLEAMGLVPFQVNPHYFTGPTSFKKDEGYQELHGETRDDRIEQFHEMNDTPVIGLWEGGLLEINRDRMLLAGAAARVFRKGKKAEDVLPGARLDELLAG
jgi:dipeptidase E